MERKSRAAREDVLREFGELDDLVVASILALEPSLADLVEARQRLDEGQAPLDTLPDPSEAPLGVVGRIVALVYEEDQKLAEDEELTPA
jgi:hypothetical protein